MRITPMLSAVAIALLLGCFSPAPPRAAESDVAPPSGSAVQAPVFSTDRCDKDEDCAPVAQCHPDRCLRTEHAGTLPPDTMCTMECRPGTVDCGYNHCGCAPSASGEKLCALLPGARKP
jgi:hypothetical protein